MPKWLFLFPSIIAGLRFIALFCATPFIAALGPQALQATAGWGGAFICNAHLRNQASWSCASGAHALFWWHFFSAFRWLDPAQYSPLKHTSSEQCTQQHSNIHSFPVWRKTNRPQNTLQIAVFANALNLNSKQDLGMSYRFPMLLKYKMKLSQGKLN